MNSRQKVYDAQEDDNDTRLGGATVYVEVLARLGTLKRSLDVVPRSRCVVARLVGERVVTRECASMEYVGGVTREKSHELPLHHSTPI